MGDQPKELETAPPDPETDRKNDGDWLSWRVWRVLAGAALGASIIISALGLWAVYIQLERGLEHRRADIALGFVERYNSISFINARNRVLQPWLKYQSQLALANAHEGISEEQIDLLTTLIIQQDRKASGTLEADILTLANFFDELSICVGENVCDARTSCFYFQKRAADFQALYGRALKDLQTIFNLENPERGVEMIASLDSCK
ncbi:MAG: hypothetical protein AAGE61_19180 [Pseudomonadota bacterium]